MSDLEALQARALDIRQQYSELNRKDGHSQWGPKDYAMGFVGDVGDLLKLVMAKENLRAANNADAKLKHELADCLWSLLVLADCYGVDLETTFLATMNELQQRMSA